MSLRTRAAADRGLVGACAAAPHACEVNVRMVCAWTSFAVAGLGCNALFARAHA